MKLGKTDWIKICKGASILSTGGGGDMPEAREILDSVFSKNKSVELKSLKSFGSEAVICTSYIAGSIASFETSTKPLVKAFEILEQILEKKINALIPVEIGPGDIAETVKIAATVKLPVIDGDIVGKRSSPEIYLETITLKKLSRIPIVLTNSKGGFLTIRDNLDHQAVEKIIRNFARKSGGAAYVAGYPIKAGKLKGVVGENTLSLSKKLGFLTNIKKSKWLRSIETLTNGKLLFEGKVEKIKLKDDKGFLAGYVHLADNSGNHAKIFIKNENLILWINNKLIITCPDLICLVDKESKMGVYNRDVAQNQEVICLGIPSLPIWRNRRGLKLFGPKTFGFNFKPKIII